jgi:fatty-acyl-CoA synthase
MINTASTDDSFRWWARSAPHKPFIVCDGDAVSYAEADAWVDRCAVHMASVGITKGDRVGVVGPNSLEWIIASLAIMRVGAIQSGLYDRFLAQELTNVAKITDMRFICVAESHIARVEEVARQRPGTDIIPLSDVVARRIGKSERFERPPVNNAEVAVIVFSSGSSGMPKGVAISMASILSVAHEFALIDYAGVGKDSKNLMPLPLAPMGGFVSKILRTVVLGGTCFLMSKFDEHVALRLLVEEKCTSMNASPVIFQRISALPAFKNADLSSLTHASIGGASIPMDEFEKWFAQGATLRQTFGSTESGTFPTRMSAESVRKDPSVCAVGHMYRKIKIADLNGAPCAPTEAGEILISGPGVMEGYWNDEEATKAALRDGWYRTGDLGTIDENGNLRVTGRIKEIIITGGYKVSPFEIEQALEEIDGVFESAVFGVPDKKFGEGVGAVVRANSECSVEKILAYCRGRLAGYKVPRYVLLVHAPLPRTESKGNLAKGVIREQFGGQLAAAIVKTPS